MPVPPRLRVPLTVGLLSLGLLRADAIEVTRTPELVRLSNRTTQLSVALRDQRAGSVSLTDRESGRELATVFLGTPDGCTASCSARQDGETAIVEFGAIRTTGSDGVPRFDDNSFTRFELRDGDPFPAVHVLLRPLDFTQPAWEKAVGARVPFCFLTLRVPAAQAFYRGGFVTPLPSLDPLPLSSPTMRADWDGDWLHAVPLKASPVPATGAWAPKDGTYAGFEFQESRLTDRSAKDIRVTWCESSPRSTAGFVGLIMPPEGVETRFGLLHATDLGVSRSPNEFVLEHIWHRHRDLLPHAPTVNNVGWVPASDGPPAKPDTTGRLLRRIGPDASREEDDVAFTEGALVATGDFAGIRALFLSADEARKKQVLQDWKQLEARCVKEQIDGVECCRWRHPFEGDVDPLFGGSAAATDHGPDTWRIGAALLGIPVRTEHHRQLIPYLDGILAWARNCTFTRAGDPLEPAATSAKGVGPLALDFLWNYYCRFRETDGPAPTRDALALGRTALYRVLAVYTGDPDETDDVDPTFLLQPDSAAASAGVVSWASTAPLLRAMALYAAETGDPVLTYYLQGALGRWHLGLTADGLRLTDRLDTGGANAETKGRRFGGTRSPDALADLLQPAMPARLRVLCGREQALAFSTDAGIGIEGYRRTSDGSVRLTVTAENGEPFAVHVAPTTGSWAQKAAYLNGKACQVTTRGRPADGVVVSGVRSGDVITLGQKVIPKPNTEEQAPKQPPQNRWGGYRLVPLPANTNLDRSWANGRSWAGLPDGLHFAQGVPFEIKSATRCAHDLARGPATLVADGTLGSVFLFAADTQGPLEVRILTADGQEEQHTLTESFPARASGPVRGWRIEMLPLMLPAPRKEATGLEVRGDGGLLFAVTAHPSTTAPAMGVLAKRRRERAKRTAQRAEEQRRRNARDNIVPELRAAVREATKGRLIRVAFIPPHEAYTDTLRTATSLLGSSPVLLSPEESVDPTVLTPERYPIVVCSAHENFLHTVHRPGDAAEALKRYVAGGGCLVAAGRGVPFFYAMEYKDGKYTKVEGLQNGRMCGELELLITWHNVPPPKELPRYELVDGQTVFTRLPQNFAYDRSAGGPYRQVTGEGLPEGDVFTPVLVLKDRSGSSHGFPAATIEHHCERYKGGRVVFLWGNVLATPRRNVIALDLMRYAMSTVDAQDAQPRKPAIAVLPRDMAGHDAIIQRACAELDAPLKVLTPEEFADPAVFNPRNFPVAIHAVDGEDYLDVVGKRTNLWQTYVDYVKGGGFLLACGNMWQFYYAGAVDANGGWEKTRDDERRVTADLGLQVDGPRFRDARAMHLRCIPGQDILSFDAPIRVDDYLQWGAYRAMDLGLTFDAELVPIAEVVDDDGASFGKYAIAGVRFKRILKGAELLWFWGDLLDDERTHPLFLQAVRYAYGRRKTAFGRGN